MICGTEILRISLLVATTAAAANAMAAAQQAIVDQPRPFGYVIGDLVTQRVLLTTPRQELEPGELPRGQRVNIWFERRAPRIEVGSDGRRWLVVDYQLINAPQTLATVQLPSWKLGDKRHDVQLEVPAASISVSPLISASTSDELRPDREVTIIDTARSRTNIVLWSIALGITLAAWLGWVQWRNRRDSQDRPFAHALHELRHMDERAPEAWQALHRAFDRTAGRVLQIDTLPALFERAPYLRPRRTEIERFFVQSNERFFGVGAQGHDLSVRALCQDMRRLERRHAQ